VGAGVAWQPVDGPGEAASAEVPAAQSLYAIHVASFREAERANDLAAGLRDETGEPVRVSAVTVETGLWYRVLLGEFASEEAALDRIALLQQMQEDTYMRPIRLVHPEHEDRVAETPSAE
ncbi:MAG: SPOR domain-containing protein, partial [bacterium]